MPCVGLWEYLPFLISGRGAWALIGGAWQHIDWADAAWSGRVHPIEDVRRLFPNLPPFPEEFNPDDRELDRGLRYVAPRHHPGPRGACQIGEAARLYPDDRIELRQGARIIEKSKP
jgi:hypothetical protein